MSVTRKPSYSYFDAVLRIKTKRKYSAEELLELIRQNFGEKYGALEVRKKALLGNVIAVNGVNRYEIFVIPIGNQVFGHGIMINQEEKTDWGLPTTIGGMIRHFMSGVFNIFTLGIRYWQIWGVRKNWHIMKPLSEDIAKLVD